MAMTIRRGLPLGLNFCTKAFAILLLVCYQSRINQLISSATAATTAATIENDGGDTILQQDSGAYSPWQPLPHQIFRRRSTYDSPVPSVEIDCAIRHFALDFAIQKLRWHSLPNRFRFRQHAGPRHEASTRRRSRTNLRNSCPRNPPRRAESKNCLYSRWQRCWLWVSKGIGSTQSHRQRPGRKHQWRQPKRIQSTWCPSWPNRRWRWFPFRGWWARWKRTK